MDYDLFIDVYDLVWYNDYVIFSKMIDRIFLGVVM